MKYKFTITGLLILALFSAEVQPACAEWYVSGLLGANVPYSFSRFRAQYLFEGRQKEDDLGLDVSQAYGIKLGYSPKAYPWLAFELEGIQSYPNQHGQPYNQWARPPSGSGNWSVSGGYLAGTRWSMLTVATNLILRYPTGKWMPYIGAGPALFRGNYGGLVNNPSIGLNVLAGVKYQFADNWRVMVEYHFQENKQTYKQYEVDGTVNGFTGIYQAQLVLVGLEYTLW